MTPRRLFCLALTAWALSGAEARAHFLFIRIGPMAEAGRWAEVYFSEQATAGDPRFVEKIAHTELWLQATPGEFRKLEVRKAVDRLRAHLPASGSLAVVGVCEYGVLARPNQVPFLLRYYPKALAGRPDDLNRLRPRPENPMEIAADFEGDRVHLVALRGGRPLPGASFTVVDEDLDETKVGAGPDGRADWTPDSPGRYSIYVRHDSKETGEVGGKRYEEVREFATLALSWPPDRRGADPEAVSLFEEAIAARARWEGFPGFEALVEGEIDGRPFRGKVAVGDGGEVRLEGIESAARSWVEDQLGSIAMHRVAEPTGPEKPVLRFGDEPDENPLGRLLIFEGGRFASSYRVKDRLITAVNRHVGRDVMTINTIDHDRTPEGTFLPRCYVVQYWDDEGGALRRTETVRERWTRVGRFDLPAEHTVTAADAGGLSVRSLRLSGHRLADEGRSPAPGR